MKRYIAILWAVILAPCSLVTAQDEPKNPATIRMLLKGDPDIGQRITVALADAESATEYWVGLQVAIPDDADRKKLNVPKDQPSDAGLIVQQVVPDAPGDKAGIKVGDLLMKLGDKTLKSLSDPLDAIRDAKDSKLALTFVRDGKVSEVVIKPTKRPSNYGLYGPEPPKAEAGSSEAAAKAADARKAERVLELRWAETVPSSELQQIRAELAQVNQIIAHVNSRLAQLESRQASPDRERIMRQMAAMKRAAAELTEVGRSEDADRLKEELRKLSEKLKALGQPGAGDAPLKGALVKPPATFSAELGDSDAASATKRAIAFLQRAQTDLPSAVPPEVRRAVVVQRAEPDGAAISELRKQVEQLRREVKELRESSAKSKDSRN